MRALRLTTPPLTAARRLMSVVLIVMALALVYGALCFGIYYGLTSRAAGANDFYSRWMGARALLRGQNPYSPEVTRDIQRGMYGRLARADEDQVAFAYPLYAAFLAAPFAGLPYAAAQAMWMALLVMGVVAGLVALTVVNRLVLSPPVMALVLLGTLFFYPSVRGIFLGQYALVSFALVALASLAIATEHQTRAGFLLAVSASKPQPVILLLPVILFWAWVNGKRGVVWSALSGLAVLMVSSFVLVPSWLGDFLNGLRNYAQYAPVGPSLETFWKLVLPEPLASILFYLSAGMLLAAVMVSVWRKRRASWVDFQPVLGLVALVTTLTAGRIGTPDQIFLLMLWLAWFGRWRGRQMWLLVLGCVLLALPWSAFLVLLDGNREAIVVTTILPLFTLGVLFLKFGVTRARRSA